MNKFIFLDSLDTIDYEKAGLKCGLEIHQQLDTGKLFCLCPCRIISNDNLKKSVERKLRVSLSESGEIDRAASEEFRKDKSNIYLYNDDIACLVDLDEEPPKKPNQKAIDTAMKVGLMLNLNFFDKMQFMRKLIINGSVTSGFQRTAMLGFAGYLNTSFGKVNIEGVNIEEDAARTIKKEEKHNIFALDRQGIPLIEITTGPQIKTPQQGYDAAFAIGNLLRSFKETKRGLGTIRQDINVSIEGGARVEIKGAQNLKMIPQIIDAEVKRQLIHISIINELKQRKINKENFSDFIIHDISKSFVNTTSKVIITNLNENNAKVLAIKLFNFKNILGHDMQQDYRFATEISDRNKHHFPQIKGLFHSDELPKYGITDKEVEDIRKSLSLKENDSFILIAADVDIAKKSLVNVFDIICELITKVPSEVRQVDPKGTKTLFLRPMPGSARMYPETDISQIEITKDYLDKMKNDIPELYNEKIERLTKDLNLENARVEEMLSSFDEKQIKNLIAISGKNAAMVYNIVFELPKDIKKRENIEPVDFKYELMQDILKEVKSGNLNTRIIRDLFISLYKDQLESVENLKNYLDDKGLIKEEIDENEFEQKIKEIIEKNKGAPFGALMGIAMKEFNGKVDGKKISEMLKRLSD